MGMLAACLMMLGADCGPVGEGPASPSRSEGVDLHSYLCRPVTFCGCEFPRWPGESIESCNTAARTLARAWDDRATELGLEYEGECVHNVSLHVTRAGSGICAKKLETASLADCKTDCQVFFGDGKLGDSCEPIGRRMSTCSQRLRCGPDGVCHEFCDVPTLATEGQFCGHEIGLFQVSCDDGLACVDNRCTAAGRLEDACTDDLPFAGTLRCVGQACVPKLAAGDACVSDDDCVSEVCQAGVCFDDQAAVCVGFHW